MTCPSCDDLRRQLREAREQLEEARVEAAAEAKRMATVERLDAWRRTLMLEPSGGRMLLALVDAAPRVVSTDRLAELSRPTRDIDSLESPENVVRTRISQMRKALTGLGLRQAIHVVWGVGYTLSVADAAALRLAMGETS